MNENQDTDERTREQLLAAAELGEVDAQFRIGVGYATGEGGPGDFAEAARWWRKAAEQGDALAQRCLASCYAYGWGVAKDEVQAERWYGRAEAWGIRWARDPRVGGG